ncbi:MbcA/ParS/Xre antitoxin family protein [Limnobacter sp.]|uniref:MbcA/ParS/Xre antitoxin family protein n=1 Tax=Limnobacter sp. TaxID=2003368 RepID=UPI00344C8C8E
MKSYQFATLRLAIIVFGDSRKARSWMSRPQKMLGEKSACEIMQTAAGCELIQELLAQIDHGFSS